MSFAKIENGRAEMLLSAAEWIWQELPRMEGGLPNFISNTSSEVMRRNDIEGRDGRNNSRS